MCFLFFSPPTYLDYLNDHFWWPVILFVLILILGFYFIFFYSPKVEKAPLKDEEVNVIINHFGGMQNIESIKKDGSRYTYNLISIKDCNFDALKELGASGIFVSGNSVKLIFPFDAEKVMEKFN